MAPQHATAITTTHETKVTLVAMGARKRVQATKVIGVSIRYVHRKYSSAIGNMFKQLVV